MKENVVVRTLADPHKAYPVDRGVFYKDQLSAFKKYGKPTKAVDVVDIFIFNSHGELLVQKRSFDKGHNPGLLDKSIGGHMTYGDAPDYTVMLETVQELQVPSIVLRNKTDFKKTRKLLKDYSETIAILEWIHEGVHVLPKIINGEKIDIANNIHVYFGLYNGKIRPIDREAKGVLWYSLKELKEEMRKFPETFSGDMYFFLKHFGKELENFTKGI